MPVLSLIVQKKRQKIIQKKMKPTLKKEIIGF